MIRCPECLAEVKGKSFCCNEHKQAFHNRSNQRGRVLVPLFLAARITRGGSRGDTETGKKARRDMEQITQRWIEEDREEKRMDAVTYVAQRNRLGYRM